MRNIKPLELIDAKGTWHEIGRQYGEACSEGIKKNVEVFVNGIASINKADKKAILATAQKFVKPVEEYAPEFLDEMKGIAEGSGVSFEDVLIINTRTEFMALGKGEIEEAEGCTVIVATPEVTANHHMLMAQNCDMNPRVLEAQVIVKKKKKGKPNTIGFHDAGMLIKTGFNSAGIVCLGNGLFLDKKMQFGVPVQLLVHGILTAENLCEAVLKCVPAKRTWTSNKVIGSAQGLCVDVEVAQDFENFLMPEDGILVHTNHFVGSTRQARDMGPLMVPNTLTRRYRALQLLAAERGNITVDTFKKVLSDHVDKPDSLCAHVNPKNPLMQWQTNLSVIIDIDARAVDITKGPPCQTEYVHLDFQDMF